METTTHTIGDLIEIYGDMLSYIRQDAEVHDPSEHDDDDDFCPTKLYERGQAVYDASKLWRLTRAAPDLLNAAKKSLILLSEIQCDLEDDKGETACIEMLEDAIGQAA